MTVSNTVLKNGSMIDSVQYKGAKCVRCTFHEIV